MAAMRLAGIAFLILTAAAGANPAAPPAPTLHGKLTLPISSLAESIDSFEIAIKGKPHNTGPVKLTLDPDGARAPTVTFDFDAQSVEIDTDLVVNAPLLKRMNAPKTTVAVTETAQFDIVKVKQKGSAYTLTVAYVTDSVGTVNGGPADGAQFRNKKDPGRCPRYPPQSLRLAVHTDAGGNVTDGSTPTPGALLCSDDNGTLTFEDQQLTFAGTRKGVVGK